MPDATGPAERLRRRADFVSAAAGAKISAPAFVLQMRQRDDDRGPRLGFTVSRKVGNAVVRNRVRRRLKEAVRLCAGQPMRAGCDYVTIGRRTALTRDLSRLTQDFADAVGRVHARRGEARPAAPLKADRASRKDHIR